MYQVHVKGILRSTGEMVYGRNLAWSLPRDFPLCLALAKLASPHARVPHPMLDLRRAAQLDQSVVAGKTELL